MRGGGGGESSNALPKEKGKTEAKQHNLDVLKVWQATIEIVLRSSIVGFCVVLVIASALGIYQLEAILPNTVLQRLNNQIKSILRKDYNALLLNSVIACGLGLGVSTATIIAEVTIITVRFVNFSLINFKIKIFLAIDIILSLIFAVIFLVDAVLASQISNEWRRLLSDPAVISLLEIDIMLDLRDTMIATAVSTIVETLILCFLVLWVFFFLVFNWDVKIFKTDRVKVQPASD